MQHHPTVLYYSAYPELAASACGFHTAGYLIKEHSDDQLAAQIEKVLDHLSCGDSCVFQTWYEKQTFQCSAIERIELLEGQIQLFYRSQSKPVLLTERSLASCMKQLDPSRFFLISRSCILNLDAAAELSAFERCVLLTSGKSLSVSRRRWPAFFKAWLKRKEVLWLLHFPCS